MNKNIVQIHEYQYAEDFLRDINYGGNLYKLRNNSCVFRGHSHSYYRLVPTALREDITHYCRNATKFTKDDLPEDIQILNEVYILRDFFEMCDYNGLALPNVERLRETIFSFSDIRTFFQEEMWLPEDLYEIAALAQHYGLPTRLLDWTYDIHIAIYFALSDYLNKNSPFTPDNIVIWALDTKICINTVMLQCPLPIRNQQNNEIRVGELLNIKGNRFPLRVIRPQYNGNPNLYAQKGVFTTWELKKPTPFDVTNITVDRKSLDELLADFISNNEGIKSFIHPPLLYKISVPNREVKKLYDYIKSNHVDASTVFPGYNGAVKTIQDDMAIKNLVFTQ